MELAEAAHTAAAGSEGWRASVATPAKLYAGTGHAAAVLALRTRSTEARRDAQDRLGKAIRLLDPIAQARAVALCLAQMTAVHLEFGKPEGAVVVGTRLLEFASGIRSGRLAEHLSILRRRMESYDDPPVKQLAADLSCLLGLDSVRS